MRKLILLPLLLLFIHCKKQQRPPTGLVTEKAMVVSAREEASKIGTAILKKGGNAFDAMVATEMALAVAYPFAGNLGGGGFMVYRKSNGDVGALDYREKAPLAAHKDMYLDSLGNVIPGKSTQGATAVGVPGTIAGIFEVHEKYGSLPMEELLAPVIALAEKGVLVTKKQASRMGSYTATILKVNGDDVTFPLRCEAGDTIKHIALSLIHI